MKAAAQATRDGVYPMSKKEGQESGFSESVLRDKHGRLARNALHDLFDFGDQLEAQLVALSQMPELSANEQHLRERLEHARSCYQAMIEAFRQGPAAPAEVLAGRQQHSLTTFSDALLDIMRLLGRHRVQ